MEVATAYKIAMPVLLIMSISIFILRDWIILLLFSPEFLAMKNYFTWQLAGDAFKVAAYISGYVAVAQANSRLYIAAEIFQASLLVLLCYFFVQAYGAIGCDLRLFHDVSAVFPDDRRHIEVLPVPKKPNHARPRRKSPSLTESSYAPPEKKSCCSMAPSAWAALKPISCVWRRNCHGRGIEVQVLLLTQKHEARLLAELRQYAVVHFAADMLKNPASPLRNNLQCMAVMPPREAELEQLLAGVDCVHVCGVWSLVYYIRHVLPRAPRTKVVCGVYHQNEFNFRSIHPRFFQQLLFQLVDQSMPAGSMLFFNEKSIDTAVELYGEKYTGSDVFPIGIKFRQDAINPSQNVQSRKIISVGRITSFKTYNFKMVAAFPEILKNRPCI